MKKEFLRTVPSLIVSDACQYIGSREEQQDYYKCIEFYNLNECEKSFLAVAADGMGGYEDGRRAAQISAEEFVKNFRKVYSGNINKALISALNNANEKVKILSTGGATLVSAVIINMRLYWMSVGDSRIYLFRNGILRQLTVEHNYKRQLLKKVRNREMSIDEVMKNTKANALTSYIGVDRISEYDYNDCEFPILTDDIILLCSDGLYKTLSNTEIADILSEYGAESAKHIINAVKKKKKKNQDNTTVIVLSAL